MRPGTSGSAPIILATQNTEIIKSRFKVSPDKKTLSQKYPIQKRVGRGALSGRVPA
jgi:hypothetical protein